MFEFPTVLPPITEEFSAKGEGLDSAKAAGLASWITAVIVAVIVVLIVVVIFIRYNNTTISSDAI